VNGKALIKNKLKKAALQTDPERKVTFQ